MSLDHARTMAAYNRWMNERLHTVCARMDDTERKHNVGISRSGRDPGLTDLIWMPGLVQPVEGPI